jgi:hypothetical protein
VYYNNPRCPMVLFSNQIADGLNESPRPVPSFPARGFEGPWPTCQYKFSGSVPATGYRLKCGGQKATATKRSATPFLTTGLQEIL